MITPKQKLIHKTMAELRLMRIKMFRLQVQAESMKPVVPPTAPKQGKVTNA